MNKMAQFCSGLLLLTLLTSCFLMGDLSSSGGESDNPENSGSEKELTAFRFKAADNAGLTEDVSGSINNYEILVTLPFGVEVSSLIADFSTQCENVLVGNSRQVSGVTANNFSAALVYTLKAEDGTYQNYRVSVSLASPLPADSETFTLPGSDFSFTMNYANSQSSITFPRETNDSGTASVTRKFAMGETEVTNALVVKVLQWAYLEGWFTHIGGNHNSINLSTVNYGYQQLINLDLNPINYEGAGFFSVDTGYEDRPAIKISWYGAVFLCNLLTEMYDGNSDNVVYGNITSTWTDTGTTEDFNKTGFRLPSYEEWEYSARYLGKTPPDTGGSLDTERVLMDGHYWTPGDYASGARENYSNIAATQAVAVYTTPATPTEAASVKSLGLSSANTLGLYDMSGNVFEWCYMPASSSQVYMGGGWSATNDLLQVGNSISIGTATVNTGLGFRLCRTAE